MTQSTTPTRRERQRLATLDEIVQTARDLLRTSEDGISVRSVAAEMGMTAPALYRYVDGYPGLLEVVGEAILNDVGHGLVAARDRHPADDPGAQSVAMVCAFRSWAVHHREEFALVFANVAQREAGEVKGPGVSGFADLFGETYLRVWERYRFPIQADEDFDPQARAVLERGREDDTLPCVFPGRPLGLCWHFLQCWVRIYGVVTLEVFKHMAEEVVTSGLTFLSTLDDLGAMLGFGDDLPRLRELAAAELAAGRTA